MADQEPELPLTLVERAKLKIDLVDLVHRLSGQVSSLDAALLRLEQKLDAAVQAVQDRAKIQRLDPPWLYGVVLLLAVTCTTALVVWGAAAKPTVSIEYNVGEIIGGILVGAAALLAAAAYRRRG